MKIVCNNNNNNKDTLNKNIVAENDKLHAV